MAQFPKVGGILMKKSHKWLKQHKRRNVEKITETDDNNHMGTNHEPNHSSLGTLGASLGASLQINYHAPFAQELQKQGEVT